MIFFRLKSEPSGVARPLRTVRILCLVALAAYPAGALLRATGPDTMLAQVGGLLLIALSLASAGVVATSRVSRIAGEVAERLDEYEQHLRTAAMQTAYALVSALALLGVIYLALAPQFDLWVPAGYDQWNGVFWGVFLLVSILPVTILSLRLQPDEVGDQA